MKESNLPAVIEHRGVHFNAFAASDLLWRASVDADPPEMSPVDVVLVCREDDKGFIRRERDVFYFEFAGSQSRERAAVRRDRIEMHPSIFFRRKQQTISSHPLPEI